MLLGKALKGEDEGESIEIFMEEKINFQFAYHNLCFSAIDFNVEKIFLKFK
jgi:hypothetical protein